MTRLRGIVMGVAMAATTFATSAMMAQGVTPPAPALRLRSFTVVVRDYDEALRWYTEKLGFVVVRDQAFGAGRRFIMVAPTKDAQTGIVLEHWQGGAGPAMTTTYADRVGKEVNIVLDTDDVTATATRLAGRGVTFQSPPKQMPWGGEATFTDLYGNTFVLVGPLHGTS
jgi:catechol 2,3-dioxygenase-like lactoylglutathione lyase family enzyme